MRQFLMAALAALPLAAMPQSALVPTQHGDFGHYTFALTWQPGICSTEEGCTAEQPREPLIGLHGLWASRPKGLIDSGLPRTTWWSRGCDLYHHSSAPPPISAALDTRVESVMPHFAHSLLMHEYDKHVQCFGFDPTLFFTTELSMRDAVVRSPFGAYLMHQAGRAVKHGAVIADFEKAFATGHGASLQLQCGRNAQGQEVLTQFWITIKADALAAFPGSSSLMDATTVQDTCPGRFLIPAWPKKAAM